MANEVYDHLKELARFKIEFVDDQDEYHKLDGYIKKVYSDFIVIDIPQANNKAEKINDGSEINLIFPRDDGVLIAQCMVIGRESKLKQYIRIKYPHEVEILERREYVRIPLKVRVEINCISKQNLFDDFTVYATTRNISGSGVSFISKEPIKENYDDIECKIYLDDGNHNPVSAFCNFVYSKKVKVKNDILFLTALTYKFISDENSSRIVKECFKYQIKRKHLENFSKKD